MIGCSTGCMATILCWRPDTFGGAAKRAIAPLAAGLKTVGPTRCTIERRQSQARRAGKDDELHPRVRRADPGAGASHPRRDRNRADPAGARLDAAPVRPAARPCAPWRTGVHEDLALYLPPALS